jgi:hypothetical protein
LSGSPTQPRRLRPRNSGWREAFSDPEEDAATISATERHRRFSYAVGNFISTTPAVMHLLLKSNTRSRLEGLLRILRLALDDVRLDLEKRGLVSFVLRLKIDSLND